MGHAEIWRISKDGSTKGSVAKLAPAGEIGGFALDESGFYRFDRIRFPVRNQGFDAHLARLRIGTALNTRLSTNAFIQFNSVTNTLSTNVRFRYNFREGNDLWIVYDEGINTHRHRLTPTLPFTNIRTILIKYTHTFQT